MKERRLEAIGAPYMVIGAFAAIVYGSTRTLNRFRSGAPGPRTSFFGKLLAWKEGRSQKEAALREAERIP